MEAESRPAERAGRATMANDPNATDSGGQKSSSFGMGSFVFALVLAFLLFLLVASMMRHHFFRGGHPHHDVMSKIWPPDLI
jgi:hypothetical protein